MAMIYRRAREREGKVIPEAGLALDEKYSVSIMQSTTEIFRLFLVPSNDTHLVGCVNGLPV